MNSLKVGKVIYSLLINDTKLNEKVKKQIYPLIADIDTSFPFIVYKRNGIEILTSKDGFNHKEVAHLEIIAASDKYNECVEIASLIADLLNNKNISLDNIKYKITIDSADEDYIDNTFIQKLNINIELR